MHTQLSTTLRNLLPTLIPFVLSVGTRCQNSSHGLGKLAPLSTLRFDTYILLTGTRLMHVRILAYYDRFLDNRETAQNNSMKPPNYNTMELPRTGESRFLRLPCNSYFLRQRYYYHLMK